MNKRVLIVDDEPDIRRLLVSDLKDAGFAILELATGEQVLGTVLKLQPDVIVMDLTMPHVNGYEALVELKANPQAAQIPVIIASALASKAAQIEVRDLGAVDFLVKPWQDGELVWRVEQALNSATDLAA